MKVIEEKDGRPVLSQAGHALTVSAAKSLLDALNTREPYYVVIAYERIEGIVAKWRQEHPDG